MFSVGWTWQGFCRDLGPCWSEQRVVTMMWPVDLRTSLWKPIPLVVTKRCEGPQVKPWWQPATQATRHPNYGKILAKPNQPRTSETYRRQDDVFRYELQFLLSGVLPAFHNLNYKLQRKIVWCVLHIQQSYQKWIKKFSSSRTVTRKQGKRHSTSNGLDQCQNGPSNPLTSYREESRSTQIVVAYPRPAFSATKRTNHAPTSFDQQVQVSKGHTSCRSKEK